MVRASGAQRRKRRARYPQYVPRQPTTEELQRHNEAAFAVFVDVVLVREDVPKCRCQLVYEDQEKLT